MYEIFEMTVFPRNRHLALFEIQKCIRYVQLSRTPKLNCFMALKLFCLSQSCLRRIRGMPQSIGFEFLRSQCDPKYPGAH